jgi:hypothetical protein
MASKERIEELNAYVRDWEIALNTISGIRDRLLRDKARGLTLVDASGFDMLQDRINEADAAVKEHQKILIRMTSLRDRAVNGENV